MECSTETNAAATSPAMSGSQSPSSSLSPPSTPNPSRPQAAVISPCAACKILRRRCAEKCVLAPYFPPTDPAKFTIAHRVFGASNIIKFLQELPEAQRADAVSSMVYEASARIRDPVYGCAGAICQLQRQVSDLQAQLARAQAEVVSAQCQQANLVALLCMEMAHTPPQPQPQQPPALDASMLNDISMLANNHANNSLSFLEESYNLGSIWEPLWT